MKRIFLFIAIAAGLLSSTVSLTAQGNNSLADTLREIIDRAGMEAAQHRYEELRSSQFAGYEVDERALNSLGYRYLQQEKVAAALAIFTWNVERFPNSGNAHDSLGEAYVHAGQREPALQHYRRALELDPKNRNAEAMLAELATPGGLASLLERLRLENALQTAGRESSRAVVSGLRAQLEQFLKKYPQAKAGPRLVATFFYLVEAVDLHLANEAWHSFLANPNAEIAQLAATKLQLAEAITKPLDLTFTAVDGRSVDLVRLRGKVVLIDFWATWCGPCKAELPNVKAVYGKYHDQGFEIVGISLDREQDRQKLIDYCREHGLDWPQFYDGQYWKNSFAVKYGIRAIPATFLLDRTGRLVALGVRGERLEPLVRRHLGLPQ